MEIVGGFECPLYTPRGICDDEVLPFIRETIYSALMITASRSPHTSPAEILQEGLLRRLTPVSKRPGGAVPDDDRFSIFVTLGET